MIETYNVNSIFMLTELDTSICPYWPTDPSRALDVESSYRLTLIKTKEIIPGLTKSTIELYNLKNHDKRVVRHYLFSEWPDNKIPKGNGLEWIVGKILRIREGQLKDGYQGS